MHARESQHACVCVCACMCGARASVYACARALRVLVLVCAGCVSVHASALRVSPWACIAPGAPINAVCLSTFPAHTFSMRGLHHTLGMRHALRLLHQRLPLTLLSVQNAHYQMPIIRVSTVIRTRHTMPGVELSL